MTRLPAIRLLFPALLAAALAACDRGTQTEPRQPPQAVSSGQTSAPAQPERPLIRASDPAPSLAPPMTGHPLPDFSVYRDVGEKKGAFFAFLQPLIVLQNSHLEAINKHLQALEDLFRQQGDLHPDDRKWLEAVAEMFRVDADSTGDVLEELIQRVQPIPVSLVLAQAANESAWGTSRFAREGNNLFGMWCYTPGCGIAPLRRDEGATHEVAAYQSVEEGIFRYLVNLNANDSYAELREIRSCLQTAGEPVTGRALAAGLSRYSARGSHYAKELRSMIRINRLEHWDKAWWGDRRRDHPCYGLVQVRTDEPDPLLAQQQADTAVTDAASEAVPSAPQADLAGEQPDLTLAAAATSAASEGRSPAPAAEAQIEATQVAGANQAPTETPSASAAVAAKAPANGEPESEPAPGAQEESSPASPPPAS